jgi:hypothetical protein
VLFSTFYLAGFRLGGFGSQCGVESKYNPDCGEISTEKEAQISHYWRRIESMLNPESHAVAVKEKWLPVRTPPWLQ